ncbi:GNAT family N-acetyltransferase [Sneathiella chinensis]|uniref:N-acetyltransferase n=1 Tax=Sneathiella chinensis TaxID=349750 RepID=A0ABQ5U370_9PROT|nr:N-acetyltransferase [Sneathiella chinensis]GLQ05724.1 N-acetyltransferase [Sneathiella chinensis]
MYQILHEQPAHAASIEPLLDLCFGPERFLKTAYKVRQELQPLPELSFVALDEGALVGTLRYWPIRIGNPGAKAILLGPIAIHPDRQGEGIGVAMIRQSLAQARADGHRIVVLVGDPEYYTRFGFTSASERKLELPGPVEDRRFLVSELIDGALDGIGGMIAGDPQQDRDQAAIG